MTNYELKHYIWGDAVAKLITINTAVWIIISIGMIAIPASDHNFWVGLFALPSAIADLPLRFWTVITYMFSQADFLHLLVNMMWLLLFGRLMLQMLGERRLWWLYIGSGLAGAAGFVISNIVNPGPYPYMLGASCAVIGVIGCAAMMLPKLGVQLLFLGNVKIVWIAVMAIVLFVVLEPSGYVSIAHAAGLAYGVGYAYLRRSGFAWRWRLQQAWQNRVHHKKDTHRYTMPKSGDGANDEAQLDRLLDKVHRSGYQSLSPRERQKLFELSQKIKK